MDNYEPIGLLLSGVVVGAVLMILFTATHFEPQARIKGGNVLIFDNESFQCKMVNSLLGEK